MLHLVRKSLEELDKARLNDTKILVGLSGGKDSLATLDLCIKSFGLNNVYPFYMEFIPDLRITEEMLGYAIKRFNLKEIIKVPAEGFIGDYKSGLYGWEDLWKDDLPDISRKAVFLNLVHLTGIQNIAVGIKSADNLQIRRQWDKNKYFGGIVAPIWKWKAVDVVKYNILNKIEIPKQTKEGFRGIDLSDESLLYLHKFYPDDFKKIEYFFPFIGAKIFQIEHYGIKYKKHFV